MDCYCCSGKKFESCCEPFLNGNAKPPTAETLMRSRFAAYVRAEVDYLVRSTHPSTRSLYAPQDLMRWATSNRWEKLEIISCLDGTRKDKTGTVEFKAYYVDRHGQSQTHHEISQFRKELGKWFYVEGQHRKTN
jgi:SEC-C motif-containing protein